MDTEPSEPDGTGPAEEPPTVRTPAAGPPEPWPVALNGSALPAAPSPPARVPGAASVPPPVTGPRVPGAADAPGPAAPRRANSPAVPGASIAAPQVPGQGGGDGVVWGAASPPRVPGAAGAGATAPAGSDEPTGAQTPEAQRPGEATAEPPHGGHATAGSPAGSAGSPAAAAPEASTSAPATSATRSAVGASTTLPGDQLAAAAAPETPLHPLLPGSEAGPGPRASSPHHDAHAASAGPGKGARGALWFVLVIGLVIVGAIVALVLLLVNDGQDIAGGLGQIGGGDPVVAAPPDGVVLVESGRIATAETVQAFSFTLDDDATVEINVRGRDGFDPLIQVLDDRGVVIATDDDGGSNRDSRIVQRLGAGVYRLNVEGFASSTGPFAVEVLRR